MRSEREDVSWHRRCPRWVSVWTSRCLRASKTSRGARTPEQERKCINSGNRLVRLKRGSSGDATGAECFPLFTHFKSKPGFNDSRETINLSVFARRSSSRFGPSGWNTRVPADQWMTQHIKEGECIGKNMRNMHCLEKTKACCCLRDTAGVITADFPPNTSEDCRWLFASICTSSCQHLLPQMPHNSSQYLSSPWTYPHAACWLQPGPFSFQTRSSLPTLKKLFSGETSSSPSRVPTSHPHQLALSDEALFFSSPHCTAVMLQREEERVRPSSISASDKAQLGYNERGLVSTEGGQIAFP